MNHHTVDRCKRAEAEQIVMEKWGGRNWKNVEVDKEGPKLCVVGNNKKDSGRERERKHLYSNMVLSAPLYGILKRRICCCYLYLWIHAIWPSVKWWVIPAQQEELVLNLQSPSSPSPPSSSSFFSPYCTCLAQLNMDGWRRRRNGSERTDWGFLLSPVSHLRRCGTGINGIQQLGGIAAGSVCF